MKNWPALTCLAAMIGSSATARAAEDYAPGFIAAFGSALGAAGMAMPYLVARDERVPGVGSVGMVFGGTGTADRLAFEIDVDMGGYPSLRSRFGWTGRSQTIIYDQPLSGPGEMGFRYDALAMLALAGNVRGPLVFEGLLGFVVWPRFVSYNSRDVDAFAAIGPTGGLRLRAISIAPRFDAELEIGYAPLFGATPSERLHHTDVASALAWHPLAGTLVPLGFELKVRRRIAFGGEPAGAQLETTIMGGFRIQVDEGLGPPTPAPSGASPAAVP